MCRLLHQEPPCVFLLHRKPGWWTCPPHSGRHIPRPQEHVTCFLSFNVGCWDFHYFLPESLDLLRIEIRFRDWACPARDMRSCVIHGARRETVARPGWGNWLLLFHTRVLVITSHSLLKQRFIMEICLSLDFHPGAVVLLSSTFLRSGVS